MPLTITIPLLNPNEPEALLAALHVAAGQPVSQGAPICTLETTKATHEVTAEASGYFTGLRLSAGQTVSAGEILGYIADSPDWQPPASAAPPVDAAAAPPMPAGLRLTEKARLLAAQHGLDLGKLPLGTLVTEQIVRQFLAESASPALAAPASAFDSTGIIVYGGGGHGRSVIELLRALGSYRIAGVVDDGFAPGELILGVPVLGGADSLPALRHQGLRLAVNAVGGIGNLSARLRVFERLAALEFGFPALVHPSAWVEPSASLSAGVQVFPHAYVGSLAHAGFGCIINTGAIVSHDCKLGDYVNLSPGATLAGNVTVGAGALVGMRATVNINVSIGAGARLGNGTTVKADVPANGIVPAGTIFPR